MKKIYILFILIISAGTAFSQGFNSVSASNQNNIIAVGGQGKIFWSNSGGNAWSSYVFNGSVDYKSVSSAGSYYFLTGNNGKIYKTGVNSINPSELNTGNTTPLNSVFFIDTLNGFACGNNGIILRTSNGGISWTSSSLGSFSLNSIHFRDNQNGIAAGEGGRIFLTSNSGASWTLQASLTNRNLLSAKYFSGGIIVAGEYGVIITKSNAGSFQLVQTKTNSDIRGIAGSYASAHVCGGGGFIRNNKNGNSGFFNFESNPMLANLVDICFTDTSNGFAVSSLNNAVIKTTDGGNSWSLTGGTTVSASWAVKLSTTGGIGNNLCQHPYDRNSVFVMYGNRVYVSRNKGDTWTQIATTSLGTATHSFYVSPVDTNIWVAAIESSTDRVIRTTDYGVTWTTIVTRNFSNYGQPLEMDQNNPSVFYFAPDAGGFLKSTDNGATFADISSSFPFRSPCDIIVMYDSSNVIFVADGVTGSGLGDIYKSADGGSNWTKVHTNSSSSEIPSMCNTIFDKSVMYATNWSGGNIYRTTNFGDNWSLFRTNSASGWASDICKEDPTVVLTGSYGSSTWLSTNSGANFNTYSSGGGAGAGMLVTDRGCFLNMMTGGLYKLNVVYSVVTNLEEKTITGIPADYNLYQNFPNPFNPSTIIRFSVPQAGMVSVKVFDNLGREVKNILSGYRQAGTYEVSFNASELGSGIYYYRLTAGYYSSTKKMVLIK